MLVISDTSPLNYLVWIRQDHILPAMFRVATVPAVLEEMAHARSPKLVQAWAQSPPPWLSVQSPTHLVPNVDLGRGEHAAISLAAELHADLLLMDERAGTIVARNLGLRVAGTLGILALAHDRGLLRLEDAIDELRRTSFRATERVYADFLRASRNRPDGPRA